jgi:hypothetical protein
MFFENFPKIGFKLSDSDSAMVQDIIRAVRIDPKLKNESLVFIPYQIADNETPEMISHKFYGTTAYHWVIMVLNEKFDPYEDFPKSDKILRKYCELKYDDILGTHHYIDSNGIAVDEFNTEKIPVTNLEYETDLNDKKRGIKVLRLEALNEFVGTYLTAITS